MISIFRKYYTRIFACGLCLGLFTLPAKAQTPSNSVNAATTDIAIDANNMYVSGYTFVPVKITNGFATNTSAWIGKYRIDDGKLL